MLKLPESRTCLVNRIPLSANMWRNDREIWRWCRQNTLISHAQQDAWLKKIESDPTIKMFGITDNENYELGVCGLTSIDRQNQSAEFSLYIAPDAQGNGHGKEALKTLITHAFQDLNLNRIWGETFDGNPALKMFLSLGMKTEAILRESYYKEGRFIDSYIVSILRSEWKLKF